MDGLSGATGEGAGGGGPLSSGATGSGAPGSSTGAGTGTRQDLLHPNTASSSSASGTGATANASGATSGANTRASGSNDHTAPHILAWSSALEPAVFVTNAGQWSDGSNFHVQGPGYQLATSASAATIELARAPTAAERQQGLTVGSDTVQLNWTGTNSGVAAIGQGQLAAVSNFYTGSDPSQWRTGVSEYSGVQYANLWNGVDLVYHGNSSGNAEYDFDVAPGASVSSIGFTVTGAKRHINARGQLVLTTPDGNQLVEDAPVAYQTAANGTRQAVASSYRVNSNGSIGLSAGTYDTTRQLVIDPSLSFAATVLTDGFGYGVAGDGAGDVFVAGGTQAANDQAFVSEVNSAGSVVWTTYFNGGSGTTSSARGVALGSDGSVFIAGYTNSTTFPTTSAYESTYQGGGDDAFVAKLTPAGAVVYSTYLGGSGTDKGLGIGVDQSDNQAIVVGSTTSSNFPTLDAAQSSLGTSGQSAFVTRFNAAGTGLVFSTYLGGSSTSTATGVAVESNGYADVVGSSGTSGLSGRYSPAGALGALTVGGSATGVGVDDQDRIYETGSGFTARYDAPTGAAVYSASSGGLAVAGTAQGDAVVVGGGSVTEYNTSGGVAWSTSWDAGDNAAGNGVAVDPLGNIDVAVGVGSGAAVVLQYAAAPAAPVATGFNGGSTGGANLTDDTTPTINGTAPASSTVSVYRTSTATGLTTLLGTTAASAGGLWTYTLSAMSTTGTYDLATTDTVSGVSSARSTPVSFTLDTTAPVVTVAVASQTYDTRPWVAVTASDLYGFASGTTVALDEAVNGGAWTSGYATGTLVNGTVEFTGYTALPVGTIVDFRARLTDAAGNQGTSPTATVTVNTSPTSWATISYAPPARADYGAPTGTTAQDALIDAGDVTTQYALSLDQSSTSARGTTSELVYNSQEASPAPTVQMSVQSNNALSAPTAAVGTLTWDGSVAATVSYDVSQLSPGGNWVFAAQPTSGLANGLNTYSFSVFITNPGSGHNVTETTTGYTFLVNRSSSPYGAGWSFSDTDALVTIAASGSVPAGVLREFGSGGWSYYQSNGSGGYISPAGDSGTLTLSGGTYTYTAWDGEVLTFNSAGQQTKWASPDGTEVVTYTYAAGGGVATVASPDGSVATCSLFQRPALDDRRAGQPHHNVRDVLGRFGDDHRPDRCGHHVRVLLEPADGRDESGCEHSVHVHQGPGRRRCRWAASRWARSVRLWRPV